MTICSNLNVIFCKLPTQLVWRYFPILVVCAKRPQMYGNSCSFPHNAYDSYTSLVIQMKGVFLQFSTTAVIVKECPVGMMAIYPRSWYLGATANIVEISGKLLPPNSADHMNEHEITSALLRELGHQVLGSPNSRSSFIKSDCNLKREQWWVGTWYRWQCLP